MRRQIGASILFLFLASCSATQHTQKPFTPSFKPSTQTTHAIPEGQAYTFGYLKVLENRSLPHGKTLSLPVYIFNSRSKNPNPDPIIYTVGGPGSSTMPSAQYMEYYQYLDDRDLILIEQRGTAYASPHLDCPEWANAIYQSNLPGGDAGISDSLLLEAALACRERLVTQGIDLNSYHTNSIAADIADLVTVLEIESYNLLTISYSTKIAQVLLRDYPRGIRSVVMDSALPLAVNYEEESVDNLMEAVDKLLSDCEADSSCAAAYPNLKQRFWEFLKDKTDNPLVVEVENPENGNVETVYVGGKDLIEVFTIASSAEVGNIPYEMNRLLNNDLGLIKRQLADLFEGPGNGAGMGMRLSVWCSEEFPFFSQTAITEASNRHEEVQGMSPAVFEEEICNAWAVRPMSEIDNQAVQSEIPVLLISGEYDNETPSKWAEQMTENLPNSFHLIFPGWKHTPTTNWGNPCAMQAANDFFNDPKTRPHPACLKDITGPVFTVE